MRLLLGQLVKVYPKSLMGEFYKLFGAANTEKLLTVFAGTTLRIPTTKELDDVQRDICIYESISRSSSASETRRLTEALSEQYHLTRKQVRRISKHMRVVLKEGKRFSEADKATGQLKKKTILVSRKNKRRM